MTPTNTGITKTISIVEDSKADLATEEEEGIEDAEVIPTTPNTMLGARLDEQDHTKDQVVPPLDRQEDLTLIEEVMIKCRICEREPRNLNDNGISTISTPLILNFQSDGKYPHEKNSIDHMCTSTSSKISRMVSFDLSTERDKIFSDFETRSRSVCMCNRLPYSTK